MMIPNAAVDDADLERNNRAHQIRLISYRHIT
jgi:hypothetical protein